jgi:hypothetical protein
MTFIYIFLFLVALNAGIFLTSTKRIDADQDNY